MGSFLMSEETLRKKGALKTKTHHEVIELSIEHYNEIIALWKRAGLSTKPHGWDSFESLQKQLSTFPVWILGIKAANKLAGVVLVTHDGRKGWINRLSIDPQFQGKGLGKRLLKATEEFLHQQGINIIAALIEEDNKPSRNLFSSQGYSCMNQILYYSKRAKNDI